MATSTLGSGTLVLAGTTSGTTTVTATAVAGTTTLTLPAATDTLVGKATTDTLTNKTLTGAAMNGTVGATTPSTGAFTTVGATGTITSTATGSILVASGATTSTKYIQVINTGGSALIAKESSVGGTVLPGSTAYALTISTNTNTPVQIGVNDVLISTFSSTGLAVTGTSALTVNRSGAQGTVTLQNNGTSTGVLIAGVSNGLVFYDAAAGLQMGTWAYSAGLAVTGAIGVGGATPTTSGTGITFPATQSASTNANTLDDYEEGTWTPSIGGNATYTTQVGFYTKIGRQVTIIFNLEILLLGTGSTSTITGVPIPPASNMGNYHTGSVFWETIASSQISVGTFIQQSTAEIYFYTRSTAGTSVVNASAIIGSGTILRGTLTYFV